jgi:hypothetical protein
MQRKLSSVGDTDSFSEEHGLERVNTYVSGRGVLPRAYRFRMPFAVAYATSSARELNESFCMRFAL